MNSEKELDITTGVKILASKYRNELGLSEKEVYESAKDG